MNLNDARSLSAKDWHARAEALAPEGRHFIDGVFVDSADGRTFDDVNPATGALVARVARGGQADIDRAVASGLQHFRSGVWSRMAPRERMNILYRYAELLEEHSAEFALLDVLDMGKPIQDMLSCSREHRVLPVFR
jgi:gamma-glutamyl-gamma-aminobutyraldehyde dehydrogenase